MYGGEPLLAKEILWSLSEKFLALCEKFSIEYYAFIVTNASLLDDADIENFKRYKINGAQITIDGPQDIHNSRRRSITGASTFDRMIERVDRLLNENLSAVVRINIDRENLARVDELLDTLAARIDKREELKIGFGQVLSYTDVCKSIESDCYNNEQFADIMLPLYEKVLVRGFSVNKMAAYPSPRVNFCCADYVNSFVVDNRGELYRCWHHVGNLKRSSGKVEVDSLKIARTLKLSGRPQIDSVTADEIFIATRDGSIGAIKCRRIKIFHDENFFDNQRSRIRIKNIDADTVELENCAVDVIKCRDAAIGTNCAVEKLFVAGKCTVANDSTVAETIRT